MKDNILLYGIIVIVALALILKGHMGALFNEPYTVYNYKLCAGSVIGFTGKDNCIVASDVTITSWKTVVQLKYAVGGCTYASVTADGIDSIVNNTCVITCDENWVCSNWSTCINELQNRNCVDTNNCGTTELKPSLSQSCVLEGTYSNVTQATVECNVSADCADKTCGTGANLECRNNGCVCVIYGTSATGQQTITSTQPAIEKTAEEKVTTDPIKAFFDWLNKMWSDFVKWLNSIKFV